MAVIKPWAMNALAEEPLYDAATLRRHWSGLLAPGSTPLTARAGILDPNGFKITLSDPTFTVGTGLGVVTTVDGSYVTGLDTPMTFTLAARDATNKRIDKVIMEIIDTTMDRTAVVRVLTGTPAAIPVAPVTPSNALSLGTITVQNTAGGPPTITPAPGTAANGGIIVVPNTAARDVLTGASTTRPLYVHRSDSKTLERNDGSGWAQIYPAPEAWRQMAQFSAQTVPHGTPTSLTWSPDLDDQGNTYLEYSGGALICKLPGMYEASASLFWSVHASGRRAIQLWVNSDQRQSVSVPTHDTQKVAVTLPTTRMRLAMNDRVDFKCFQNCGISLQTDGDFHYSYMSVRRVAA